MHATELSFVPLLIVIALSFLVPVLLSPVRRLGIPVIVGEIIAGIVVGQSGLGLVREEPVLQVLSVFGFAYLMFLSGLEMDFSQVPRRRGLRSTGGLQRARRSPFVLGGLMFALTGLCSLAAGFYLRYLGLVQNPWLMALILSTTSLGVVAPVLKERGLLVTRYGQTMLVCALIADFVTILLISSYVLLRSGGLSVELLLILLLMLAFLAAYQLASRFREHPPAQKLMQALSSATSQIQVRGSLAVALVFIGLAESLGMEDILGAFLAGVIVSMLTGTQSSVLKEKLDAIGYGFFIPIFFIMVGVKFDLPALLASGSALQLVLLLTAIAFSVKLVAGLVFRMAYSWRETLAASMLLSARLSLIIAVATIGAEIGAITPAFEAAIILMAILTCLFSPILFAGLAPKAAAVGGTILVIGSSEDAAALTDRLQRLAVKVAAVTDLPSGDNVSADARFGTPPAAMVRRLREAGIDQASAIVAMTDRDADTLHVCRIARTIHAVQNIVAWVHDPGMNRRFIEAGARVINPSNFKVLILESLILSGQAIVAPTEVGQGHDVRVVKLRNWWMRELPLRNMALPGSVSVLSIERAGEVIFPSLDTIARANDIFTLAGEAAEVDLAARRLAKPW